MNDRQRTTGRSLKATAGWSWRDVPQTTAERLPDLASDEAGAVLLARLQESGAWGAWPVDGRWVVGLVVGSAVQDQAVGDTIGEAAALALIGLG